MNLFYLGMDVKQDIDSGTKQEVAVDMKQEDAVTTTDSFLHGYHSSQQQQ